MKGCARFSVVIPTWKNIDYLDLAYRGLVENSAADHELIVFFNEYDDACRRWLDGRKVIHASSERNLGVCGAVNRAAAMAGTDYICYLNDDMYPLPGWDVALSQYIGIADKLWLSGTALERGKATACYVGGVDYGDSAATFQEARLLDEYARYKRPYNVVSTWTPILLARRDWEAVGGFDEAYFPGNGSDPDLAMKMYAYGCRHFIGVGTSLVYHFSRCTIQRFDDRNDLDDPRAIFERKWGMSWRKFLSKVIRRDEVIDESLLRKVGVV